jgi:hypothetical protein
MDTRHEHSLIEEIEQLRRELHRLISDQTTPLTSAKACVLSARLDLLIARYMNEQLKQSAVD